jgi:hypothetical protein
MDFQKKLVFEDRESVAECDSAAECTSQLSKLDSHY